MGREIKFRAWGIWEGEMSLWEEYRYEICDKISADKTKAILMQYTGLKDKNGKEIYEGDILQGIKSEWWDGVHDKTVVVVDDIACLPTQWGDWSIRIEEYTIIGNIYENPDLLSKLRED